MNLFLLLFAGSFFSLCLLYFMMKIEKDFSSVFFLFIFCFSIPLLLLTIKINAVAVPCSWIFECTFTNCLIALFFSISFSDFLGFFVEDNWLIWLFSKLQKKKRREKSKKYSERTKLKKEKQNCNFICWVFSWVVYHWSSSTLFLETVSKCWLYAFSAVVCFLQSKKKKQFNLVFTEEVEFCSPKLFEKGTLKCPTQKQLKNVIYEQRKQLIFLYVFILKSPFGINWI